MFRRQSTSLLGYSHVQFRRGSKSYDLNEAPVYSLKQMVSAEILEYDYPVNWTKPLILLDEMKEFQDIAGTIPKS